jgi:hypothetical protein
MIMEKSADRMDGYLTGGADHEDYIFQDEKAAPVELK